MSSGSDRGERSLGAAVPKSPFRLMLAAVGAELVGAYLLLRGSDWAFDDNIYLGLAHQHGLTWSWLDNTVFGHFSPAYRFGYSVVNHVMPIDYRWVMVLMLCMLGAAAIAFFRVIELLFRHAWLALAMTVWFVGSILFVRAIQWWAFGLQGIPTVLADLLCLYGYLRYVNERSPRWLSISAVSLAIGVLFYEKAAFAPLYIVLVRLLFLTPELSWRSVVTIARRERWIWLAYAVVLAVWYAGYRASGANLGSAGSPTAAQWARFYEVGWLQSVVPAAFGFGMPFANIYTSTALSSLQVVEIIIAQVLFAGAVVASTLRDGRAWRAWASLVFVFALSGYLTGEARIKLYGPSSMAGDLRYWVDFAWLTPLFACFAFFPRPQLSASAGAGTRLPRPALVAAIAVLLCGYTFVSASTAHHMQRLWPGVQARAWQTNLERTLTVARRRWPDAVVAQERIPFFVVEPQLAPANQLSFVLGQYGDFESVDGPVGTGPILSVTPSGEAVPATPLATLHHPMNCRRHTAGDVTRIDVGHDHAPAAGLAYLLMSYVAHGSAFLPLSVNSGISLDASADSSVQISPHTEETIAWLGPNQISQIRLTTPSLPGLCIRHVNVVTLQPAARP